MTKEEVNHVKLGKRLRWEKDAKGPLLIFDCSNNTKEEAWAALYAFDEMVKAQPLESVRVLADFENAHFEPKLTAQWKANFEQHSGHVQKMAGLNVTGGMKVVLAAYRFFSRLRNHDIDNRLRHYEDEDAAKTWLLEN